MHDAVLIGGGRDNVVENNIFIECDNPVWIDARGMDWEYFQPDGPMYDTLNRINYQNPPWSTRYPELARILEEHPQAPLGNTLERNVSYQSNWDAMEKRWRAIFEQNNLDQKHIQIADNFASEENPGFVDAANMNFQLKDDSVVYQKIPSFKKIPFEKIGLYQDEYRATWPISND